MKAIGAYAKGGQAKTLRQTINDAIESSRRTFNDAAPLTLVLSEKRVNDGIKERQVFDLKSGGVTTQKISAPLSCALQLLTRK